MYLNLNFNWFIDWTPATGALMNLNSNELKVNAYKYALSEYPNSEVNKLIEYHKKNGGISFKADKLPKFIKPQNPRDMKLNIYNNLELN